MSISNCKFDFIHQLEDDRIHGIAVHEIGAVDEVAAFLGVMVAQDAVIGEVPTESVSEEDDETFGGGIVWGRGDVGWEAVKDSFLAYGEGRGDCAGETGWTGHFR